MEKICIKQMPRIKDDGYYYPNVEYCEEGTESTYRKLISKEDFIECFNKWIINTDLPSYEDYVNRETESRYNKSEPKFKCPNCGGKVRKDTSICLTTVPPLYIYECDDCDFTTHLHY